MFKCSNCEKEYDRVGKKNLHEYHCLLRAGKIEKREPKPKIEKEKTCEHSWRILNNRDRYEGLAIQRGYIKICVVCEELE